MVASQLQHLGCVETVITLTWLALQRSSCFVGADLIVAAFGVSFQHHCCAEPVFMIFVGYKGLSSCHGGAFFRWQTQLQHLCCVEPLITFLLGCFGLSSCVQLRCEPPHGSLLCSADSS